jgi:16S rRNA (adenine1518-N6/adenine1519-N6)-dimethyltransferase
MTPAQLKHLLKENNLRPNKLLGQNFLLNEIVLQDIVFSVPLEKGDAVLEIGPGIANLTRRLLERATFVLAIDKDPHFAPLLRHVKREHKNFDFRIEDILRFNFQEALHQYPAYHVVANIPYYITGKIIKMLLQAKLPPKTITMLVQKEVAHNAVAQAGSMNLLALSVQLRGEAKIIEKVLARDFYPAPKVDSAVLQIVLYPKPRYPELDEKRFFQVARACFSGKRKQLHNTLVNNLHLEKEQVETALKKAGIDSGARPQELSLEQWVLLTEALSGFLK